MTKKHNEERRVVRHAKTEWVVLGVMRISPAAQRKLDQSWVDHIASNFVLEELGKPTVNKRDGHAYVIDGQHRVEAIKQWLGAGWQVQQIQCEVYEGLTESEEADKFDMLNNVRAVNSFDRFRVRVTAGREVETRINEVVQAQGLTVGHGKNDGRISAVGTLRKIYLRAGEDVLGRTLRIVRDAYSDAGMTAIVLDGIGHFCQRYDGQIDEDIVVDRLNKAHAGVGGLLSKAEILRRQIGNSKAHCVAAAAVDIINSGRGGNKLASWWKMAESA